MADNPQLINRYPTDKVGGVTDLTPDITLDWSLAVETTQFSTALTLKSLVKLNKTDTTTYLDLNYVSYDPVLKRVTLTPAAALEAETTYTLTVNKGVKDSVGRQSIQRYVWDFTTAESSVSDVSTLLPLDASIQEVFPSFSWASASPNTFDFQIDDNPEFNTPIVNQALVTNSYTPVAVFTSDRTYYWRVRAKNGVDLGKWSDTYSFYFGFIKDKHPTTQTTWQIPGVFALSALSFKNGLSNQAAYPPIRLTFSEDVGAVTLSDYITVKKKLVLPRNDDRTTYQDITVPGTLSVLGAVVTFVPTDPIQDNYRYKIKVAADFPGVTGSLLGEELEFYFTSTYAPYYVDISAIRARFLSAESRIPDDLINYYIYQASLEAHSRVIASFSTSLSGILGPFNYDAVKEYMIRDATKFNSYGVLKWTEALATFRLLQSILREELRNIGRERKQGEYMEKLDEAFLKAIQSAKDDAKQELDQWAQLFGTVDSPSSVSIGSQFNPGDWDGQPYVWREGRRDNHCM